MATKKATAKKKTASKTAKRVKRAVSAAAKASYRAAKAWVLKLRRKNPLTAQQAAWCRELNDLVNRPYGSGNHRRIQAIRKKMAASAAKKTAAKKNPKDSVRASHKARKVREMFTGAKSRRTIVKRVDRSKVRLPGRDFAKLGDLESLTVNNRRVSWEAHKQKPIVVTDPKAKRLFFLGGDQDLAAMKPVRKANPGGMHDMGEVAQIEYYSRKKFDDFKPTVYFHNLGEENGIRPRLMYDPRAKQMYLAGGDYKIKDVGIVN